MRVVADWLTLKKKNKPLAKIFHVAYFNQPEATERPITFVFNGGPGAASAFLHMGALGPQRIAFGENGAIPAPPTRLVDNQETWLAFSDLVFVDPVGTGFSRPLDRPKPTGKEKGEAGSDEDELKENPEFWEVERDLASLGDFIARFLSVHHRWTSPIFIAGESYGGFRVAKMARKLQEDTGVGLNGAILISPAIEFSSLFGTDYDLANWVECFPTMAAVAHAHGRCRVDAPSFESLLEQAESFAREELAMWLLQGEALGEERRQAVAKRAADWIGLDAELVARAGGRITATRFCRTLLADQRLLCGHYDGSVTGVDPFPDRNDYEGPDPTLYSIDRVFTSAINQHLRQSLQVETDLEYRLLSLEVNESWKDKSRDFWKGLQGAMDDLRYGMSLNPYMKVFITHGYFDLVTPYFSSERLIDLMKLDPRQRESVIVRHFKGGHMFYSWDESRRAFSGAIRKMYDEAVSR